MKDDRIKKKCLALYLKRYSINDIHKETAGLVAKKTLYNWKQSENWDKIKESNLDDESKINNSLTELVLKLMSKAKQKPDKMSLENLENAMRIYDAHLKSAPVKRKR